MSKKKKEIRFIITDQVWGEPGWYDLIREAADEEEAIREYKEAIGAFDLRHRDPSVQVYRVETVTEEIHLEIWRRTKESLVLELIPLRSTDQGIEESKLLRDLEHYRIPKKQSRLILQKLFDEGKIQVPEIGFWQLAMKGSQKDLSVSVEVQGDATDS